MLRSPLPRREGAGQSPCSPQHPAAVPVLPQLASMRGLVPASSSTVTTTGLVPLEQPMQLAWRCAPHPCCVHCWCTPGAPRYAAEATLLQGSNKLPSRRPWAAQGRAAALDIQGCYHRLGEVQGRGVSTHVRCAHLQREGSVSTAGPGPPRPSEAPVGVPSTGAPAPWGRGAMGTAVGAGGGCFIPPASCSSSRPPDFSFFFLLLCLTPQLGGGVCGAGCPAAGFSRSVLLPLL